MAGDDNTPDDAPITVSALDLDERGRRLYNKMRKQYPNLDPVQTELLVEACRIADQLEKIHRILRGDVQAWAFIRLPRNSTEFTIQVDQITTLQRQLQLALKTITATLTVAGEAAPAVPTGGVNDIAARAATKRAQGQGGQPAGGSNPPRLLRT